MNITDHALMRWAQRIEDENIISQNTFKDWKKDNADLVLEYEKDIKETFEKSEYLTEGIYDDTKRQTAKFYIYKEEMLLFVVNKEGLNIVTLYEIDFGISKLGNRNILNELLEHIENREREKKEFEATQTEELQKLTRRKKTLEMEKEELRERLNLIESEQGLINKEIENTRNRGKVLDMNIKNTYRKIIKSIEF